MVSISHVISLLIHQSHESRAHRGHIQYDHLLQLFYNITNKEEKMEKKAQQYECFLRH